MPESPVHSQQWHEIMYPAVDLGPQGGHDYVLGKWRGIVAEVDSNQPMISEQDLDTTPKADQRLDLVLMSQHRKAGQGLRRIHSAGAGVALDARAPSQVRPQPGMAPRCVSQEV